MYNFFPWLQECTLGGYGRIASNLLKVGKLAMYPGDSKESLPISLLRMYRENNLRLGANTMAQHFQQPSYNSYIIVTNVVCSFLWQLINYMAGIISKHAYFVASLTRTKWCRFQCSVSAQKHLKAFLFNEFEPDIFFSEVPHMLW
jgi:hypothetical protein